MESCSGEIPVGSGEVGVKSVLSLEDAATQGAGEAIGGVTCHVPFQVVTVSKPLATLLTHKLWLYAVLSLVVLLQQFPSSKTDATHMAWDLLTVLVMYMKFVQPQTSFIRVTLPTCLTEVVELHLCFLLRQSLFSKVHFPERKG